MKLRHWLKSQPAAALILCFIIMILISQVTKAQNNAPPSTNPIPNENAKIGTTDWQIDPMRASRAYERDTEGYASHTSINVGEQITFYVSTAVERDVDIEIYRMGYYPTGPNGPHPNGGTGGRWVTTLANRHVMLQDLPEANHMTGLIECNWQPTATWIPPATGTEKAVSGFYLAKIVGKLISPEDQGKDSYIIFVVRDDSLQSDFVFQSAVTTYQAYNAYPGDRDVRPTPSPMPSPSPTPIASWKSGKSLYDVNWGKLIPELPQPNPNVPQDTQARKVSFNRPYLPDNGIYLSAGQFFQWEYNFVRWMEKKGLFVSYITNIDTHKATDPVNGIFGPGKHKAFLTAGHDEYWSYEMRDNIEKARNRLVNEQVNEQPLHLGFFSSNDVHWQIRFEDSGGNTKPANAPYRTIVAYKEHVDDGQYGDENRWNDRLGVEILTDNHKITNLWRKNREFIQTCPGGGTACYKDPEDELVGLMTDLANDQALGDFSLSSDCPSWIKEGANVTVFPRLLGYEPMKIFSTYPANRTHYRVGQSRISNGDRTSASLAFQAAYYKMHSGGRVFSGGTNYWAWGVDPFPLGESWVEPGGGWYPTMYRQDAETVTMNILDCFKNGGIDCGENP